MPRAPLRCRGMREPSRNDRGDGVHEALASGQWVDRPEIRSSSAGYIAADGIRAGVRVRRRGRFRTVLGIASARIVFTIGKAYSHRTYPQRRGGLATTQRCVLSPICRESRNRPCRPLSPQHFHNASTMRPTPFTLPGFSPLPDFMRGVRCLIITLQSTGCIAGIETIRTARRRS